jgi:dihydrofolate reductase
MSKVKVAALGISLDGYAAGPNQDLQNPLGVRGPELFQWFFKTEVFQKMHGGGTGVRDTDNDFAEKSMANFGAWILGRNMFGPIRGPWVKDDPGRRLPGTASVPWPWPNDDWKGWWGENPPYHVPVFVLTHHARPPLKMEGDTTFYFVTDGIESALKQAKAAAGDKDVRVGGGVATVRQYLQAGLIDQIHLAVAPVVLGTGENLYAGLNLAEMGFSVTSYTPTENAAHIVLDKK